MAEPRHRELVEYETADGRCPFREWLDGFKDRSARVRIRSRLLRLQTGNFGDAKAVGGGVQELRIHFGPGFRVYFGLDGERIVVLLMGGDKSTQTEDIRKAQAFWADYRTE